MTVIPIPTAVIDEFLRHKSEARGTSKDGLPWGWWFTQTKYDLKPGDDVIFDMPGQSLRDMKQLRAKVDWAGTITTAGQIAALLGDIERRDMLVGWYLIVYIGDFDYEPPNRGEDPTWNAAKQLEWERELQREKEEDEAFDEHMAVTEHFNRERQFAKFRYNPPLPPATNKLQKSLLLIMWFLAIAWVAIVIYTRLKHD